MTMQSSTSFVDPKVAEYFEISSPVSSYTLKTLTGSTSVLGTTIENLMIKGVKQRKWYKIPVVSTNPFIPDCKSEIATPDLVRCHPNIRHFAKYFSDFDSKADVLLLLGRDVQLIEQLIALYPLFVTLL